MESSVRMPCRRALLAGIALLVAALTVPVATAAEIGNATAVGTDGEIFRLLTGRYGALFPGGVEAATDSEVLALEVQQSGEETRRLLVPGTAGPEPEDWASLVSDAHTGNLFLVWETRFNAIHPLLNLVAFDGESWSDTFEIIHNPFSPKYSPRLLVTHDTAATSEGEGGVAPRLLVHLVWTELEGDRSEAHYTALTLENGEFLGYSPVYRLDDLVDLATAGGPGPATGLDGRIEIHQGRDNRTALIVYRSSAIDRLVTLELDVLPLELVRLAEGSRAQIIDVGARIGPDDIESLAAAARDFVLAEGHAFHPAIVRTIAEEARAQIIDVGARAPRPDLRSIAEHARAQIIDVGAKLSGRGLRTVQAHSQTPDRPTVTQIDLGAIGSESPMSQIGTVRLVAHQFAPDVPASSDVFLHSSEDGSDAVVAWREGGVLRYVETRNGEWTTARTLSLSEGFEWTDATALLSKRVRSR